MVLYKELKINQLCSQKMVNKFPLVPGAILYIKRDYLNFLKFIPTTSSDKILNNILLNQSHHSIKLFGNLLVCEGKYESFSFLTT